MLVYQEIQDPSDCNTNNHPEYAPMYEQDGVILIQQDFYHRWSLDKVIPLDRCHLVESITTPHTGQEGRSWYRQI